MKKIINYFKSLRKSTIYKIVGLILLIGIIIWMVIITKKINSLLEIKNSTNTINVSENLEKVNEEESNLNEDATNIDNETTKVIDEIDSNTSKESNNANTTNNNTLKESGSINSSNNTTTTTIVNEDVIEESADTTILNYMNDVKSNLENKNLRESAKSSFITIVDFIFYDGTIKGYTFNELSDSAKLKVLKIALTIDSYIDNYFPNYKETISDKTTNLKNKIILKYLDITTKICEKDSDVCTQAKSDFQDMKKSFSITWDIIKSLASTGAGNLKEWYEIYSGK
jgi:hypothetical protein